jgi:hypothetical protein
MKLEIHAPDQVKAGQTFNVRAVLFNDSYDPVAISRNAFMGPTAVTGAGMTPPAVEATFGGADEPLTLQPFTFYGRERQVDAQPPGEIRITAQYEGQAAEKTIRVS